jgi:hypothetical protein
MIRQNLKLLRNKSQIGGRECLRWSTMNLLRNQGSKGWEVRLNVISRRGSTIVVNRRSIVLD